jgi:hypothetical protein
MAASSKLKRSTVRQIAHSRPKQEQIKRFEVKRLATISRRALSALHTAGLPTRLFGVALSCPFPNADERNAPLV